MVPRAIPGAGATEQSRALEMLRVWCGVGGVGRPWVISYDRWGDIGIGEAQETVVQADEGSYEEAG